MNKILSVYNTCGLNKNENVDYYVSALDSFLEQDLPDCDVVISSCMATEETKNLLIAAYKGRISFCFTDEILPVNVTFNHAVKETVKRYGKYDGYLYIDSGVHFKSQPYIISKLYEVFKSGPYAMVSVLSDTDMGFNLWGGQIGRRLQTESVVDIPVGAAVNLHAQIFSNSLLEAYDGLMPTCFASYCTESVFSFLCAAINEKLVLYKDVMVHHNTGMDGQCAGFSVEEWKAKGNDTSDHPFRIPSIIEMMKEGHKYGMGYEECHGVLMHDAMQFDENGYCRNNKLKKFIKERVFLSKELLDYDTINSTFIGLD